GSVAAVVVLVLKRTVGSLWLGMAAGGLRTWPGLAAPEWGPGLAALSAGTTSAGAFGVAGPEPARAPAAPRAGVAPRACALGIALPRGGAGGGAGAAEGAGAGGAAAGAGVGEAAGAGAAGADPRVDPGRGVRRCAEPAAGREP